MKTVLFALAVLVPALASAENPKPFVLVNGRAAPGVEAAAPPPAAPAAGASSAVANQILTAATQASAFGTSAVHPTISGAAAAAATAASPDDTSRGIHAFRARSGRRGVTRAAGRSRKAADTVPPNYTKPGALIRSEGQLPQYSDAGNARTHSVDGGKDFVNIEAKHTQDTGRPSGVAWGKPDTPPGANPTGSGSGAGGNGVTANGPDITINNDHSGNVNGNQNGGGDGHGNGHGNGNGNNDSSSTGFDPSF